MKVSPYVGKSIVNLRDEIEQVIRAWNAYELARGCEPIIDFDCHPTDRPVTPAVSRVEVHQKLSALRAEADGVGVLTARLDADLSYIEALLGHRLPLGEYLSATQGCGGDGWSSEFVQWCGDRARAQLANLGIGWHASTDKDLAAAEGPLDAGKAPDAIRDAATGFEPRVRAITGSQADFHLRIETVDVDAYWSYWLDGAGQDVRLRLNLRHADFTAVRARQFALHEVLGHGLQYASLAARCRDEPVPWVRLLSVTAPHQVLFEGLAQAMPLFAVPDDQALAARVRLDHYLQLVRAELHVAINAGARVTDCVDHARARVPFWSDETIGDHLTDCGADPRLRSYLWSYPAGLDWFVALAEADSRVAAEVLHAAYRAPLIPAALTELWPAGPPLGGGGGSVRLWKPALSRGTAHAD
jgi:hypothetical protein